MIGSGFDQRVLDAVRSDLAAAVLEFDDARAWFDAAVRGPMEPLGAEVWVFDPARTRVVLVRHPWRAWVPPGGRVEPGETPREGAARELFEETGVRAELLDRPAAVAVRSFHPSLPVTLSFSYVAVAAASTPLVGEDGQQAAWKQLDHGWESSFPEDHARMRRLVTAWP
ncbi:NUDIX domain-containing protein [Catellatospora coxensis]|uniref:NUDIX domain-containing protein n=1 Tax=Catellatospora coxensis TaxID=310354 RepID=UPI001EF17155|nr:NUDIX domain-containing protein [Catellatospora coxensis]